MEHKERRLALLSLGRGDIYSLINVDYVVLKNGAKIKYDGIPDDAKLVHYYAHPEYDSIDLVIESASFPDSPEGSRLPRPMYEIQQSDNETNPDVVDITIKIVF